MGSGASATEAVRGASPEDIRTALEQLAEGDRAKVQDAFKALVPVSADDAKAAAPFLAEYHTKIEAKMMEDMKDGLNLAALKDNPEEAKKYWLKYKEGWQAFWEENKVLLEKSFKRHDTAGNDVLSKEEAAVFFKNLMVQWMDMGMVWAGMMVPEGGTEEETKAAIEAAKVEVQKKKDNYAANKADFDAAGFKVLDVNDDGTLQLKEFLAAFEPGSQKSIDFKVALGVNTQEEADKMREAYGKSSYGTEPEWVAEAVKSAPVVVFSKSYCPYCTKLKNLLRDLKVAHTVYELDHMGQPRNGPVQQALQKISGELATPQLFVGGDFLGTWEMASELNNKGDLEGALRANGAAFDSAVTVISDPMAGPQPA